MAGGAGNDRFVVDNVGDVVTELSDEGTDTVESNISYTLGVNLENLTLTGTAANGTGNAMANTIIGNESNNVLDGDAGADTLAGGAGDDTYVVDNAGDVVRETAVNEGTDTVRSSITYGLGDVLGGIYVENLTLTGESDINGTGNMASNVLIGNGGNNRLDASFGADTMAGGAGNDTYVVDNAGDVVTEAAGEGTDTVESHVSYTLGANVENLTLMGGGTNINGVGNEGNNVLRGNSGKNILDGAGGADTVILAGVQSDYTFMSAGGVIYVGDKTAGRDGLSQWKNIEKVTFLGSGQTLDISALKVVSARDYIASYTDLTAAFGFDEAAGASHYWNYGWQEGRSVTFDGLKYIAAYADLMAAFGANEAAGAQHYLQNGRNEIAAGTRANSVQTTTLTIAGQTRTQVSMLPRAVQVGTAGNDSLTGTAGKDGLFGGDGNDTVQGYDGDDGLYGGAGHDTLDGGAGADQMAGGTGNDTYVVDSASDVVAENAGEGTDTVSSDISYTLGANVENLTLTGGTLVNGTGNTLNNVINGNQNANVLNGLAGADTMAGGAGNDKLAFGLSGAGRIDYNQLWFGHESGTSNLKITVMGSTDAVTIQDWYLGAFNGIGSNGGGRMETIEAASSEGVAVHLVSADVQRLVDAMAGMTPPPSATSWAGLSSTQQTQLQGLGVWGA
jgi:Ca2+-binding RTX toxin-like protein